MRKLLYAALLIPLLFVPLNRVDVADLLPVEAVAVYMEGDRVVLETDTGHKGAGEDANRALAALKENTPAVIYLDTAEYLLIASNATEQAKGLVSHLKSSAKVCVCEAAGRVKEVAKYMRTHCDLPSLRMWKKENIKK